MFAALNYIIALVTDIWAFAPKITAYAPKIDAIGGICDNCPEGK